MYAKPELAQVGLVGNIVLGDIGSSDDNDGFLALRNEEGVVAGLDE